MGSSAACPAREPERGRRKRYFIASAFLLIFAALGVLGIILFLLIVVGSPSNPSDNATTTIPPGIVADRSSAYGHGDQFAAIVAKYGRPDIDDSTEYNAPRPPMVTRWIEYKRSHVKIMFYPDCRVGDPPPYSAWRVIGYINTQLDASISAEEATQLLQR
jgi:hypothetical protein